jgi:hypothetical protein
VQGFCFSSGERNGPSQAIRFKDSPFASERRRKFTAAPGDAMTLEPLKLESPKLPDDTDTHVVALVVVLHGIRDMGEFMSQFEKPLQEVFRKKYSGDDKLQVCRPSYGYSLCSFFTIRKLVTILLLWRDQICLADRNKSGQGDARSRWLRADRLRRGRIHSMGLSLAVQMP